jgi:hypothetical protein
MKIDFDRALPLTEIELEKLFDLVADEVNWARTQMLTAEGLDADLNIHAGEQDFMASFPPVSFGSDIALKRQILAVLCLAHNDLKPKVAGAGYDVDKYVFLVIPARHRKFMRLVSELQARLPWI